MNNMPLNAAAREMLRMLRLIAVYFSQEEIPADFPAMLPGMVCQINESIKKYEECEKLFVTARESYALDILEDVKIIVEGECKNCERYDVVKETLGAAMNKL